MDIVSWSVKQLDEQNDCILSLHFVCVSPSNWIFKNLKVSWYEFESRVQSAGVHLKLSYQREVVCVQVSENSSALVSRHLFHMNNWSAFVNNVMQSRSRILRLNYHVFLGTQYIFIYSILPCRASRFGMIPWQCLVDIFVCMESNNKGMELGGY